jgi:flagellin
MAITFKTNNAAGPVQRMIEQSNQEYGKSLGRLASGNRINTPADDPAGNAQASGIEAQLRSFQQAQRNAMQGTSLIQVAEGGLNEINNLVMRLREIAIAAASDEIEPSGRDALDDEYQSVIKEIDRIANSTRYAGNSLLNGQGKNIGIQVGPNNSEFDRIEFPTSDINATADALGVSGISVYDSDSALDSLESIDKALTQVNGLRAKTGAFQSRLESVHRTLASTEEATAGALSRIRDTDYATESTNAVSRQIQLKAAVAVLAQANSSSSDLLRLLG